MSYGKNVWHDNADGGTPITAEWLNHIENGIEQAAKIADQATSNLADLTSKYNTAIKKLNAMTSSLDGQFKVVSGDSATLNDDNGTVEVSLVAPSNYSVPIGVTQVTTGVSKIMVTAWNVNGYGASNSKLRVSYRSADGKKHKFKVSYQVMWAKTISRQGL